MKTGTSPASGVKRLPVMMTLFFIVAAGILPGSLLAANPEGTLLLHPLLRQGMGLPSGGFLMQLGQTAGIALLWLLLYAMCGVSLAGVPLSAGMLLLRGMALGAVLTDVYLQRGVGGMLTAAVYVMPYAMVSTWLLLLGVREAMRLSVHLCRLLTGCDMGEQHSLRGYALRYGLLAVLLCAAGLLQSLLLQCCSA